MRVSSSHILLIIVSIIFWIILPVNAANFIIDDTAPYLIKSSFFKQTPKAGDTILISNQRSKGMIFEDLVGDSINPIVITNYGGQVNILDTARVLALELRNARYVKISGKGHSGYQYGMKLGAKSTGISLGQLSSNIEIENIEIDHDGFFGIVAKKDYKGNPPSPIPVFNTLIIHDCLIKNVTEGMYIGETKTPGMEFKHVHIYNNIITNTGREGVQISNGVQDIRVYNNLFNNNGSDSTYAHGNNLQIGDNTVAEVYNNIFKSAYQFGIIALGMGDINIYNNYFENNQGVFIDNRSITDSLAPITVTDNFFFSATNGNIIKNYNQENPIYITNNLYNPVDKFYSTNVKTSTNTLLDNNNETEVLKLIFKGSELGYFEPALTNSLLYEDLGPTTEYKSVLNNSPLIVIDSISYQITTSNKHIVFNVTDADNDEISTQLLNAPNFITLTSSQNENNYQIEIDEKNAITGSYSTTIEADDGIGGVTTKSVNINIEENLDKSVEVKAFPNPTINTLTLKVINDYLITYNLYTTNGQLIRSTHFNNDISKVEIDMSTLVSGTYILETRTATSTTTKPITKM